MPDESASPPVPPSGATGVLVLADGSVFWGHGFGRRGRAVGEVCFNTAMTGYQEVLTDPSYAAQIITFTFPHIGNVGANRDDIESTAPSAIGFVLRAGITPPSNFRAESDLGTWARDRNLIGLAGVDTRRLTRHIRLCGPPNGVIAHDPEGAFDLEALRAEAQAWPGLEGMDLAQEVSCRQTYEWTATRWRPHEGYGNEDIPRFHVVAIDYGIKHNILRCLASVGCKVTVVPAWSTAEEVLAHRPDGIFLSNGPGDPAATARYAVPALKALLASGVPMFGICLGQQLLALALGARTEKMFQGHHGANHPVRDLTTGKVEITSMNHGFVVAKESLPPGVRATHFSLFDGSLAGFALEEKPVFAVQYHPEASPGPQDSHYLFERFARLMEAHAEAH